MKTYRTIAGLTPSFQAILSIFLIFFVLVEIINGQIKDSVILQKSKGADCEFNNLLLDTVIIASRKKGERLFIIARPGRNEGSRINFSRLKYTRSVISDFKKGMVKSEISIANGEPSAENFGNLEFWVGSELQVEISILRNKQVCLQVPDYMPKRRG